MFRVSDLIDLDVVELTNNKTLSHIKSIMIDIEKNRIEIILLKRNLIISNNFILSRNVEYIKNGIVYINTLQNESNGYNDNISKLIDYHDIVNKTVVNLKRSIVGIIRDLWFNENTWDFVSYEMSEGYVDDIISGRKQLKNYDICSIEANRIIVF